MLPATRGYAHVDVIMVDGGVQPLIDTRQRAEVPWLEPERRFKQLTKALLDLPGFLYTGRSAQLHYTPFIQNAAVGHVFELMQVGQMIALAKGFENGLPKALIVNFSARHQGAVEVEDKDLCAGVNPFP